MKKLKGKATLLFSCDEGLRIKLKDELSGLTVRAKLDKENAIAALSQLGHVDCEIEFPERLDLIGMKRKRKRVMIEKTWSDYVPTKWQIDVAAQSYVADGWEIFDYGLRTQQNNRGYHNIILERYVDAEEQADE